MFWMAHENPLEHFAKIPQIERVMSLCRRGQQFLQNRRVDFQRCSQQIVGECYESFGTIQPKVQDFTEYRYLLIVHIIQV